MHTDTAHSHYAHWRSLPLGAVAVTGGFWARKQEVNRQVTLRHGHRQLERAGNLNNLRLAAGRGEGAYQPPVFMDSDVYKWLEAAAYDLGNRRDPEVEAMADELFDQIVQVLSGGRARGTLTGGEASAVAPLPMPPAPSGATAGTTTAPPPVSTSTGTVTGTGTGVTAAPPVAPVPDAAYELSAAGRARIEAAIPAGDPSYANAVHKVVIKAKFAAASEAYRTAVSADPAGAAQAKEILSAARRAFTDGDYDTAENYLDAALRLLGVGTWEQHIDAAMAELGL